MALIYALADPDTGNIRYCGKTATKMSYRLSGHRADARRGNNRHLGHWLSKIESSGNWPPQVIICEEVDIDGLAHSEQLAKLNEAEIRWIAQFHALGFNLLNATKGGDGCHGRVVTKEQRQKTAASNRGKKRSVESRERMRQAQLKRDPITRLYGPAHQYYGKTVPWKDPEARIAKIKAAHASPEARARQAAISAKRVGIPKLLSLLTILAIYKEPGSYRAVGRKFNITHWWVSKIKRGVAYQSLTGHDGK